MQEISKTTRLKLQRRRLEEIGIFKNDSIGKNKLDKLQIEDARQEASRFRHQSNSNPSKQTGFVPPIKNSEFITRQIDKLNQERYDEHSMMVKLCI